MHLLLSFSLIILQWPYSRISIDPPRPPVLRTCRWPPPLANNPGGATGGGQGRDKGGTRRGGQQRGDGRNLQNGDGPLGPGPLGPTKDGRQTTPRGPKGALGSPGWGPQAMGRGTREERERERKKETQTKTTWGTEDPEGTTRETRQGQTTNHVNQAGKGAGDYYYYYYYYYYKAGTNSTPKQNKQFQNQC